MSEFERVGRARSSKVINELELVFTPTVKMNMEAAPFQDYDPNRIRFRADLEQG